MVRRRLSVEVTVASGKVQRRSKGIRALESSCFFPLQGPSKHSGKELVSGFCFRIAMHSARVRHEPVVCIYGLASGVAAWLLRYPG
jgi:hypothetical protein